MDLARIMTSSVFHRLWLGFRDIISFCELWWWHLISYWLIEEFAIETP
jgi:hypothetical protein